MSRSIDSSNAPQIVTSWPPVVSRIEQTVPIAPSPRIVMRSGMLMLYPLWVTTRSQDSPRRHPKRNRGQVTTLYNTVYDDVLRHPRRSCALHQKKLNPPETRIALRPAPWK